MNAALPSKRPGRPRTPDVPRNDSGRIASGFDREQESDILATGLDARVRKILGVDEWMARKTERDRLSPQSAVHRVNVRREQEIRQKVSDPLFGHALGRLLIAGRGDPGDGLTKDQYDACMAWGELHVTHSIMQGYSSPNPKSPAMIMVAKGLTADPWDPEFAEDLEEKRRREKRIDDVRRRHSEAYHSIMQGSGFDTFAYEILRRVVIEDQDPTNPRELGALRIAANALRRRRG